MNGSDSDALRAHVADLEQQLQSAKALLKRSEVQLQHQNQNQNELASTSHQSNTTSSHVLLNNTTVTLPLGPSFHSLLLLSDSALPLGSFAYSSGLESFLAHNKPLPAGQTPLSLFQRFLRLSIQTVAYTNIPYVLAGFRHPLSIVHLDNDLDASTPCTVARRASVAQGRALVGVWEKAFAAMATKAFSDESSGEAAMAMSAFASDLKVAAFATPASSGVPDLPVVNGHFAPLWGAITLALGLNLEEAGYLFLLNHAKAVISAAVRASVMGPYMAQTLLAGGDLQRLIRHSLERVWFLQPEDAGQVVPVMDLWIGRHEKLYSRIFNS